MTDVHSCSYYCDRPECIKAQRDELRERPGSMTDRELMQQALEALELLSQQPTDSALDYADNAITALRSRLAQLEQKPMHPTLQKMWEGYFDKCYKREWVGLTDEEDLMIGVATGLTGVAIRMIEAKLKERNT